MQSVSSQNRGLVLKLPIVHSNDIEAFLTCGTCISMIKDKLEAFVTKKEDGNYITASLSV